jgi:hypothetical protein
MIRCRWKKLFTAASLATSMVCVVRWTGSAGASSARAFSSLSGCFDAMHTVVPSSIAPRATASPMPHVPPKMTMYFPVNRIPESFPSGRR